jgi:hypothetical protein
VLQIDHTSYQINNLNVEAEILVFSELKNKLLNLPTSLTEIWIKKRKSRYRTQTAFQL